MAAAKPEPQVVLQALDIFVKHAYGNSVPLSVKSQLAILRSWGGQFYAAPVFVADKLTPPRRYAIRLGNNNYPHMKLVIELSPYEVHWLFRVDAHDRHVCPPHDAPEYAEFRQMMQNNQKLVEQIEGQWAQDGLPTVKTFRRDDLTRRAGHDRAG
jgi:hypothetical protein